jgi:DNA repair protein RadC
MSEEPTSTLRVKDLAVQDRPQERLARLGPSALSDTELLAMLLRSGGRGRNVLTLSQQLLAEAGSLANLVLWAQADFRRIKGIGPVKALQLVAVLEMARRVIAGTAEVQPLLNSPELVQQYFHGRIAGLAVDKFTVLCLNRRNRLLRLAEITSGTATSSLARPIYAERVQLSHPIYCRLSDN